MFLVTVDKARALSRCATALHTDTHCDTLQHGVFCLRGATLVINFRSDPPVPFVALL
jgi:hypothetical protein